MMTLFWMAKPVKQRQIRSYPRAISEFRFYRAMLPKCDLIHMRLSSQSSFQALGSKSERFRDKLRIVSCRFENSTKMPGTLCISNYGQSSDRHSFAISAKFSKTQRDTRLASPPG